VTRDSDGGEQIDEERRPAEPSGGKSLPIECVVVLAETVALDQGHARHDDAIGFGLRAMAA
jgi:hypothetical protein